jgi:aspartate ammonia-lyase
LKVLAVSLTKIASDLRLMGSGPRAGLSELFLPELQKGSSSMPGKVNPVIPEVVNQVAFSVAGADVTVTMAAAGGQLQLNAFEPIIAHSLLRSVTWLTHALDTLRVNCVTGIVANEERLGHMVASSVGVVTALTPYIGYAQAAALAKQALADGGSIADLVVKAGLMTREDVTACLKPERLSGLNVTTAVPIALHTVGVHKADTE